MRKLIKHALPGPVAAAMVTARRGGIFAPHAQLSFSQEGEDLVLERLLGGQQSGFYVDVGAHHPIRFSNTYLLYRRGWTGINIDASPGSMAEFRKRRPRDINLEMAISSQPGIKGLRRFDEPALNTLSQELSDQRVAETEFNYVDTVEVESMSLGDVLRAHLPARSVIDVMTIDVEGRDLDVLKSNDWGRFRPRIVIVEVLMSNVRAALVSDEIQLLEAEGYSVCSKLVNSAILTHATADLS